MGKTSIDIDRKTPPSYKIPQSIELIEPEKKILDNGISLYCLSGCDQDVVRVEFLFNAGTWYQEKKVVAGTANSLLTDGTKELTADQIADKLEYFGAFVQTEINWDDASLVLYSLNKYLPEILPVMAEVIRGATYPEDDVRVYCQNKKQKMQVNLGKVDYLARKYFRFMLYGKDHPYGFGAEPEDFDKLGRDDLNAFHDKHYNTRDYTIIASGNVDEKVISELNRSFGKQQYQKKEVKTPRHGFIEAGKRKRFIEKKGALQCAIRIGRPLFNKTHEDFPEMLVLNAVLGGFFSSRLMKNIREDKGYTYGIGSSIASHKHAGFFFITTEVGAEVYRDALEEIYKEIALLREELIPEEELEIVRNYLAGSLLKSVDGPFSMAQRFKGVYRYGLDFDYYLNLLDTIKNVSPERLRALAEEYLNREDLSELIAGKK